MTRKELCDELAKLPDLEVVADDSDEHGGAEMDLPIAAIEIRKTSDRAEPVIVIFPKLTYGRKSSRDRLILASASTSPTCSGPT